MVAFAAFTVGLPLLDAGQEHGGKVVVHWEDAGETGCPAAHAPECVACRAVAGTGGVAPPRTTLALSAPSTDALAPANRIGVVASAARAVPSTRAPPQA